MQKNNFFLTATILFCIVLFGVAGDFAQKSKRPEEPVPTEKPLVLSAASINLTEQDYAEMEQIKTDIRERLIVHPDPELYSEIKGSLDLGGRSDKYHVSCIPFLGWSYEKGTLSYGETLGLWAFGDQKKNAYDVFLLRLDRDEEGKLHVDSGPTQTLDSMQKNPSARFILIRSETTYGYYFLRENGKVYDQGCVGPEPEYVVQVQGDLCRCFDWDRMAVCYEEIVKPENLAVFKFR